MNPIDDVYARIQNILSRIQEIQNLGRRVPQPGTADSTSGTVANSSPGTVTGSNSPAASTGSGTNFADLLQQALSPQNSGANATNSSVGQSSAADSPASNGISQQKLQSLISALDNGTSSVLGAGGNATADNALSGADTLSGTLDQSTSGLLGASGDSGTLQNYQMQLLQAIRELAATQQASNQGESPAP